MKLLLVDDEPLARTRLRALVASIDEPKASIEGEAADADAALAWLREHEADALLLDIRMPGPSGLALAAALRTMVRPPLVVFVSAYAEHAVEAFDLEAVDWVTKPVRRERLQAALQRVQQRLLLPAAEPVIVVQDRWRVVRVPVRDVLYLKAGDKLCTLRTTGHAHVVETSLNELEAQLRERGADLLRIHRNAVVARNAVRALRQGEGETDDGWAVQLRGCDDWLAVSRRQLAAVREALARFG